MTDRRHDAELAHRTAGAYDMIQPPPPRRRRWGWIVALVVAGVVGWLALAGDEGGGAEVTYLTIQPTVMSLEETVAGDVIFEMEGDTQALATAGGVVTALHVAEGDVPAPLDPVVEISGQTLYLLSGGTPLYRELSEGAEGPDVETLESALDAAGYDVGEVDEVYDSVTADGVTAWQEDEGLEASGAVVPGSFLWVSGGREVIQLGVEVGDRVEPGALLVRLGDPRRLRARVALDQADVAAVSPGDPASLEVDGFNDRVTAEVAQVPAVPEEGVFRVELTTPDLPGAVREGMTGTAEIVVEVRRDALVVPTGTVSGTSEAPTVEVLVDGQPQTRGIQTGLITPRHTEVLSGLGPEDEVVVGREET